VSNASCAFEMSCIDRVVPHNGSVESNIGFGQSVSDKVIFSFEKVIKATKRLVERSIVRLVRVLSGSEAAMKSRSQSLPSDDWSRRRCSPFVYSIVDGVVYPVI
jgi:hypothetical protein